MLCCMEQLHLPEAFSVSGALMLQSLQETTLRGAQCVATAFAKAMISFTWMFALNTYEMYNEKHHVRFIIHHSL